MRLLTVEFIDYTTEIEAPCEKVFALFKDIERWPTWVRGIKKAFRKVPGSDWGVGFKLGFVTALGPVPVRTRVLAYHENSLIEWGMRNPIATIVHRFDFEPLDRGGRCRVRHREYALGLFALLFRPLKKKLEEFDRNFADDLKAASEKS